jgi:hypothetical protein
MIPEKGEEMECTNARYIAIICRRCFACLSALFKAPYLSYPAPIERKTKEIRRPVLIRFSLSTPVTIYDPACISLPFSTSTKSGNLSKI